MLQQQKSNELQNALPGNCSKTVDKKKFAQSSCTLTQLLAEQRETIHTLLFSFSNHILPFSVNPFSPFPNERKETFGIDGEPFEFEWNIFPGHTTVQSLQETQVTKTVRQTRPEEFEDRIIFTGCSA